jgi:hypothetical protein
MRHLIGILFAAALLIAPASAHVIPGSCNAYGVCQDDLTLVQLKDDTAQYPQSALPPAAGGSTTIQTTAPVTSDTKISIGTYAGEVLTWLAAAFSLPIGALLTAWLLRMFKSAGLVMTQQMSDELNKVLVNGLNDAAQNGAKLTQGKLGVTVRDPIVASAIQYTIDKMPETLQGLGLDPKDGKTVEVLRARIATLAADPTVPTPPIAPPIDGAPRKAA